MAEFKAAYENGNLFTSGVAVNYGTSIIVAKQGDSEVQGDGTSVGVAASKTRVVGKQHLATNIQMGMRMPSYQVLNHADARPWQFQEMLKSDGRWCIVVFAGDVTAKTQMERLQRLSAQLADSASFLRRFTPASQPIDAVIEILTIHSSPRFDVELFDFPEILRPFKDDLGWDYAKIFVDADSYHDGHGHAYQNYGVDPQAGCVVVLRPDQHVSFVGDLEDVEMLDCFFSAFMKAPSCDGVR
jgi:phenol 2-monooxygenase